jgi:hypothetical protein
VSDADVIDAGTLGAMNWRFGGAHISTAMSGASGGVTLTPASLDIDGNSTIDFSVGGGVILSDGNRSHCARITSLNNGSGAIQFTPSTPSGFAASALTTRAAPAVIYEVTANGLERNGLLFSRQVEDLQVEFNVAGTWLDSIDGSQPDRVDTVRLSVVTRTERDDLEAVVGQRPAVANRNAGGSDTFRRRLLTNVVAPRNFM